MTATICGVIFSAGASLNAPLIELQQLALNFLATFLPRCMECRRGLAMRILSVRPSVYHTREL